VSVHGVSNDISDDVSKVAIPELGSEVSQDECCQLLRWIKAVYLPELRLS
jgi:hypothetical protein